MWCVSTCNTWCGMSLHATPVYQDVPICNTCLDQTLFCAFLRNAFQHVKDDTTRYHTIHSPILLPWHSYTMSPIIKVIPYSVHVGENSMRSGARHVCRFFLPSHVCRILPHMQRIRAYLVPARILRAHQPFDYMTPCVSSHTYFRVISSSTIGLHRDMPCAHCFKIISITNPAMHT